MLKWLIGSLFLMLAGAPPPSPIERLCTGKESFGGGNGGISATVALDAQGREIDRLAQWTLTSFRGPPRKSELIISYALEHGRLAAPTAVQALAIVRLPVEIDVKQAYFEVHVDDAGRWRQPWLAYEHAVRADPPGWPTAGFVSGPQPLAYINSEDPTKRRNPELLSAVRAGQLLNLRVVGENGERMLEGDFDIADTSERDRRLPAAIAKAEEAALRPETCIRYRAE